MYQIVICCSLSLICFVSIRSALKLYCSYIVNMDFLCCRRQQNNFRYIRYNYGTGLNKNGFSTHFRLSWIVDRANILSRSIIKNRMIEKPPCVNVCPHTLYIVVFCIFSDMRWEVIVSFVDIGGIIDYCKSFFS